MNIRSMFGSKEFYKRAVLIALPVMLQQLIQSLVSLVDNFMVSGLGDVKMSGVNVAGQIMFVFIVLINAICAAGGIYLTQYSGAQDARGMQQSLRFKTVACFAGMLLFLVVSVGFPRFAMSIMVTGNTQAEAIINEGEHYLYLMSYAAIPMTVSTIFASSMRETGDVRQPLVVSVLATLINTFFNYLLIYGKFGAPRLEVAGAAYATIIARVCEMLMYILLMVRGRPAFLFKLRTLFRIDWKLFRRILKNGGMIMVSDMLWVISETVCTAVYNGRGGADVVSGMAASFAIANLFFVSFGGITTATAVIIGKTLGRNELDEARRQAKWMLSAAIVFGIAMLFVSLITMLLIPVVFGSLSASAQSICRSMVLIMAILMPFWVYVNTQFAVSRAGGDTSMGMWVDGVISVVLIIPGTIVLARFTSISPVILYLCIKSTDLLKIVVAYWWLKKEKWVCNLAVYTQE